MQFPTANDSQPYAPIQVIDRSPIRTDLRSAYPGDGSRFVDDAERDSSSRSHRVVIRLVGIVAAVAIVLMAGSALAAPMIDAFDVRVAPGHERPPSCTWSDAAGPHGTGWWGDGLVG